MRPTSHAADCHPCTSNRRFCLDAFGASIPGPRVFTRRDQPEKKALRRVCRATATPFAVLQRPKAAICPSDTTPRRWRMR